MFGRVDVLVEPAVREEKVIVRRLLELYSHDFSEFDGRDLDPHGEYGYDYLDPYWTDEGRWPFLFRVGGHLAGFALVRRAGEPYEMAEFFVVRKYRRVGVGAAAAIAVIGRFPGDWHIHQLTANTAAHAFWRRVVDGLTGGSFAEGTDDEGTWQEFETATGSAL